MSIGPSMAYGFISKRAVIALLLASTISSCSTDGLVPPAPVDNATRVGSIARQPVAPISRTAAYPMTQMPVQQAGAVMESYAGSTPSGEGVNMDEGLGVASAPAGQPRVVGLAEEQARDIAEGTTSQPVVDGIGTDQPVLVAPRSPALSPDPAGQQVAMLHPDAPMSTMQTDMPAPQDIMPASEASCRASLRKMGATFREIPRIQDGANCGIAWPIKLSGVGGGVSVNETPMNCQVALAFAQWTRNELVPSSRARYFSGVKKVQLMGGYSCRRMNSRANNPWSEHAHGNAVDIGTIVLNSGKEIDVRKKGFFSFREKGLLNTVRSDSCRYFNTVLGPGSDPDHWNHFHFDLRSRNSGYRHCG